MVDGVQVIDINDRQGKQLKNLSSRRIVPLHPRLVELGFLDYVAKVRARKKPRLWMNLNTKKGGKYGNSFSPRYQYINRKYVTDDRRKNFHSFRHTFVTVLKQKGVSETMISELVGHAHKSITMSRYGKQYRVERLAEAISKLEVSI